MHAGWSTSWPKLTGGGETRPLFHMTHNFPKYLYSADSVVLVKNEQQFQELKGDWYESPADVGKVPPSKTDEVKRGPGRPKKAE